MKFLNKPAIAESVTKSKKQRKPKAPYTTSTMQQDAVNKLGFGSKKTMMLAQILYEGVEIPETWACRTYYLYAYRLDTYIG